MIVNEPAVVNQPLPGIDGGGVAPRGVQHRMLSGVPGQKPRVETPLQALVAMHLPETPFTLQSFAPAGAGTGFGVGFGTGGDGVGGFGVGRGGSNWLALTQQRTLAGNSLHPVTTFA